MEIFLGWTRPIIPESNTSTQVQETLASWSFSEGDTPMAAEIKFVVVHTKHRQVGACWHGAKNL